MLNWTGLSPIRAYRGCARRLPRARTGPWQHYPHARLWHWEHDPRRLTLPANRREKAWCFRLPILTVSILTKL